VSDATAAADESDRGGTRGSDDRAAAPNRDDGATDGAIPHWMVRAILLFWTCLAGLVVLYWLVTRLQGLLVTLLVSVFLALAIEPAVNRLAARGWRRGLATLTVFALVFLAALGFAVLVGRVLFVQASNLIEEAPTYIESIEDWINRTFDADVSADDLLEEFQEGGAAQELAQQLAGNLLTVGATVLGVIFRLFTIALFTFYLVADGPRLRRKICSLLPEAHQREFLRGWELAIDKTGGYLYSRALLAAISLVFHWAAFTLIGIPFPLPLAAWVGVTSQFIPVVGTYIAGFFPVLIALIDDPVDAVWVLAAIVIYQQVENYLLAPRISASTMEIHPAVAFGSVIVGAGLLGVAGALLALPAAATVQAFVSTYLQVHDVVESDLVSDGRPRARRRLDGETSAAATTPQDAADPPPGRATISTRWRWPWIRGQPRTSEGEGTDPT